MKKAINAKKAKNATKAFFASVAFIASFAFLAVASSPSSLEMSEKYSQDLQKRFQEHLTKTFGPGKSEVFVNVELGFSDDLKKDFQQALRAFLIWQMELMQRDREKALADKQKEEEDESETYGLGTSKAKGAAKSQEEAPAAPADTTETPDSTAPPYILPGYVLKRMAALSELSPSDYNAPEAPGSNASASPQVAVINQGRKEDGSPTIQPVLPFYDTSFLYSISSQVKRVMIRVVLDESLPSDAETKVQSLVSTMSDFDPGRGDQLIMNRMMLVPTKPKDILAAGAAKLFGEPQFLGPLLQWVLMGGILFFGIVMGSLVLRNLSLSIDLGSLPSWLGGALNIVHQGQQERAAALAAGGAGGAVGTEALPMDTQALPLPSLRPVAAGAIEIPLDRIGDLYSLVGRADPSRIALIASRLKPEVSAEFLKRFDGDRMAQILAAMASPQYVDPAILSKLKDEVERRMQGLVGGQEDLLRVFSQPDQRARVRMLEALEQRDPKLFKEMRSKVLLMGDLDKFEDHDLSAVLQKAGAEDLAVLIRDEMTEQVIKDKILRCLARRTAQVVMERGSLGEAPTADTVSQVQGKILLTAERMMAQGVIKLAAEGATGAANV